MPKYNAQSDSWSRAIDCCNSICDSQRTLSIGHHDCQYLDATFANFNSFATSSKTIFAVLCIRQVQWEYGAGN